MAPQITKTKHLTLELIRSSIAQMLLLARRCEQHICQENPSSEAIKAMKKMRRISDLLQPISKKEEKWLREMQIGMSIDVVYELYKKFQKGKIEQPVLEVDISKHWVIHRMPLTNNKLSKLSNVTVEDIRACGGPKEMAMIRVGQVFEYCKGFVGGEEVPSQVREIYNKYKRDTHKLVGTVIGADPSWSHRSFTDEVTRGSLLCYYFRDLMGLPTNETVRLANHIGDLVREDRKRQRLE